MDVLVGWPGGDWQATAKMVAALVSVYLALVWVTVILWAFRDIRSRTRDPFSQLVGVGLVTALPFLGIPLYLVLRPSETLQHAYDRQLEQEAILSELHSISACPQCRRPVQDEFMACPHCRTSLKEPCAECGRLLTHAWRHCPFCATTREPASQAARLEFEGAQVDGGDLEAAGPEETEPAAEVAAPARDEGDATPAAAPRQRPRRSVSGSASGEPAGR